jgi:hypothetical protein
MGGAVSAPPPAERRVQTSRVELVLRPYAWSDGEPGIEIAILSGRGAARENRLRIPCTAFDALRDSLDAIERAQGGGS